MNDAARPCQARPLTAGRLSRSVSMLLCGDFGEWPGDSFERLALGVDPEGDLDEPARDHDDATDDAADGESGAINPTLTIIANALRVGKHQATRAGQKLRHQDATRRWRRCARCARVRALVGGMVRMLLQPPALPFPLSFSFQFSLVPADIAFTLSLQFALTFAFPFPSLSLNFHFYLLVRIFLGASCW